MSHFVLFRKNIFNSRIYSLSITLILVTIFILTTNLIPHLGQWYSPHLALRQQTESFTKGGLAIENDPTQLDFDLAWSDRGIQQVWGLGVPIWRMPFEISAKLCGFGGFPDRITFAIAFFVVGYFLVRQQLGVMGEIFGPALIIIGNFKVILFPPFLALCSMQFSVYEEVIAYGFLAATMLLIGALECWRKPSKNLYFSLSLLSGLCLIIRPTLGAYGVATFVVASLALKRNQQCMALLVKGFICYIVGLALVFGTNVVRFGSWTEFGYSLNSNNISTILYAQRFGSPYADVSFFSAVGELLGALFLSRNVTTGAPYDLGLFPLQNVAFRWRGLYFSTYQFITLIAIVVVIIWLICKLLNCWTATRGIRLINLNHDKGTPGGGGATTSEIVPNMTRVVSMLEAASLWSIISSIILFAFYLRLPFITSRYLLDFGASFSAFEWVFGWLILLSVRSMVKGRHALLLFGFALIVGWWCFERNAMEHRSTHLLAPLHWNQVEKRFAQALPGHLRIPLNYTNGFDFSTTGVAFNGTGWTAEDGRTKACVSLYVTAPDCIILVLVKKSEKAVSYEAIRVKVGLKFLEKENIFESNNVTQIVFKCPSNICNKVGLQLVSIAMVRPNELNDDYSPFLLKEVSWHR